VKDERIIQRLDDILEQCNRIVACTSAIDFDTFAKDYISNSAVIRFIEIIGEAARNILYLREDISSEFPDVPWKKLVKMRNLAIHDYPSVDFQIIWDTAVNDIPTLAKNIYIVKKSLESEE